MRSFKSLRWENWRSRLTCVYLLTAVDQKNLISRHGREEEAYKTVLTVFTSLIRSQVFTLMGMNPSRMHTKIQNTTGGIEVAQYKKKGTTCCMRIMPHWELDASGLSLSDTQAELFCFYGNAYVVRVWACSAQTGAEGVWVWQCCHSAAPWGQVLMFDKRSTKTHKHESHLKDLKVSIIPTDAWQHYGKRQEVWSQGCSVWNCQQLHHSVTWSTTWWRRNLFQQSCEHSAKLAWHHSYHKSICALSDARDEIILTTNAK